MFLYISVSVSVFFLCMIYFHQIKTTNQKQSVQGLSLSMNLIKNACTILTLVSLYLSGSAFVSFIAQSLSLVLGSYTMYQYFKFKKGDA